MNKLLFPLLAIVLTGCTAEEPKFILDLPEVKPTCEIEEDFSIDFFEDVMVDNSLLAQANIVLEAKYKYDENGHPVKIKQSDDSCLQSFVITYRFPYEEIDSDDELRHLYFDVKLSDTLSDAAQARLFRISTKMIKDYYLQTQDD